MPLYNTKKKWCKQKQNSRKKQQQQQQMPKTELIIKLGKLKYNHEKFNFFSPLFLATNITTTIFFWFVRMCVMLMIYTIGMKKKKFMDIYEPICN